MLKIYFLLFFFKFFSFFLFVMEKMTKHMLAGQNTQQMVHIQKEDAQ